MAGRLAANWASPTTAKDWLSLLLPGDGCCCFLGCFVPAAAAVDGHNMCTTQSHSSSDNMIKHQQAQQHHQP